MGHDDGSFGVWVRQYAAFWLWTQDKRLLIFQFVLDQVRLIVDVFVVIVCNFTSFRHIHRMCPTPWDGVQNPLRASHPGLGRSASQQILNTIP
jgi:hypothetical protein